MSTKVNFTRLGDVFEAKAKSDLESLDKFSLVDHTEELNDVLAKAKREVWDKYSFTVKALISKNEAEVQKEERGDPTAAPLSEESIAALTFAERNLKNTAISVTEGGIEFVFENERFAAALEYGTSEIPPIPMFSILRTRLYEGASDLLIKSISGVDV